MSDFSRGEMLAQQFLHTGQCAVCDHGDALNLFVVLADKVLVGEPSQPGKLLA